MRILHYFLGFPPYRSGGLTAYCVEIMESQKNNGDEVIALWPGRFSWFTKKTYIIEKNKENGISSYEIINPLPVSLDEGITEFDIYMKACEENTYEKFLINIKPDVVHIHTLMGLHKEFVMIAKKLDIRTVFTSHDYFGLCSKVTFYKEGEVCSDGHDCVDCVHCNQTALSINKIKILQSPLYRLLKDSWIVKQMRKQHRKEFYGNEILSKVEISNIEKNKKAEMYKKLRNYYIEILSTIDEIHFNSTVARDVYLSYFTPIKSRVVSITRKDILDKRSISHIESNILRVTYLATAQPFKGFNTIVEALDSLWEEGMKDFQLQLYSLVENIKPYMNIKNNGFKRNELEEIFANTDILIAPSICKETFGFTVLEALSHGVPVIVSDNVGAKDIIGKAGLVISAGNSEQLKNAIKMLDKVKLMELREEVFNIDIKTMDKHVQECYDLYTQK